MEQTKKTKTNIIIYRVVPLVCAIVLTLYSLCPFKAHAADYYFDMFVTDSGTILGDNWYLLTFPQSYCRISCRNQIGEENTIIKNGVYSLAVDEEWVNWSQGTSGYSGHIQFIVRPFGSHYLRLADIPPGSELTYYFDAYLGLEGPMYHCYIPRYVNIKYYDAQHKLVDQQNFGSARTDLNDLNLTNTTQTYNFRLNESATVIMDPPENAITFQVWAYISASMRSPGAHSNGLSYSLNVNNIRLLIGGTNVDNDGIIAGLDKIDDQMGELNSKNDVLIDNTDNIVQQNNQLIQQGVNNSNQNNEIIGNTQQIIGQNNQIINGTPNQQNQVGGSVDRLEGSASDMEQLTQDMIVEKPDPENIDIAVDDLLPDNSMNIITQPILKLWDNPLLYSMIVVILTLVMISWVMFGKKG